MAGLNFPRYIVKRPEGMEVDDAAPDYEHKCDILNSTNNISTRGVHRGKERICEVWNTATIIFIYFSNLENGLSNSELM
jgi:hypothetical protein